MAAANSANIGCVELLLNRGAKMECQSIVRYSNLFNTPLLFQITLFILFS
jgi:hypothetical protein